MPEIKAFRALRPSKELAKEVSCLPYDVMNREEAKKMAMDYKHSFLHIIRAEIDLPESVNDYDEKVYHKAKENLDLFVKEGFLKKEDEPVLYLYKLVMNLPESAENAMKQVSQTGLVCLVRADDYSSGKIKKHELTRVQKEEDRIRHFQACNACTESVFLAHATHGKIHEIKQKWMQEHDAEYHFQTQDGINHSLWKVDDELTILKLQELYGSLDSFYIADGHHRSASAAAICAKEGYKYFLATIFSQEELNIMDYNRVISDLNGYDKEEILEFLSEKFEIIDHGTKAFQPPSKKRFGMLLHDRWYELILKKQWYPDREVDVLSDLDVSILQNDVIAPIFKIFDVTKDERIDFVGGIRGLKELEKRVQQDMKVAFSLHPTSIEEVFEVADRGLIMPPKSTWFEPKLRSGLFMYEFEFEQRGD